MIKKSIKSIGALVMVAMFLVLAAPVMAEETSAPTSTSVVTPSAPSQKLIDGLACMQAAVATRESSVIGAWDTASVSIKTSLTTRKDALNSAWSITNRKDRYAALVKAWKDYRNSVKSAKATFNKAKNSAWKQFNTDKLACKAKYGASNTTALDYGTVGSDLSL